MAGNGNKSESTEIISKNEPKQPNPFFSFFQNFRLDFPQLNRKTEAEVVVVEELITTKPAIVKETESLNQKPDVVRFGDSRPIVPPPLKLEVEDSENTSNPAILWQVYALGGFIVLKWAWARWQERKAKGKSSDEQPQSPPADD